MNAVAAATAPSIDLRLGDCLDRATGLPAGDAASVDVTITDPPFDARTHRAAIEVGDWRRGRRAIDGALPFSPLAESQLLATAAHLARVTRRWIIVFAGECQLDLWRRALEAGGARFVRFGVVERKNPRPQMSGDRPGVGADLVVIAHASGMRMRWNGRGRPARWTAGVARFDPGGKVHPTQKPLPLMRALVDDFSEPDELVCDPFAGAGTTAVACAQLGRAFVGWERDATYYAAARNRVATAERA
jgi:site-specific DNA-methyltransferase (adenine-specific)